MVLNNRNKKEKGFTLAETLVVVAITAITILATMQIIADMIRIQNRTLAQETMFDQVSYFFDYLSKDVRMADTDKDTGTGRKCDGFFGAVVSPFPPAQRQMVYQSFPGDVLFLNQRGECVRYFYDNTTIGQGKVVLAKFKPPAGINPPDTFALPLTSDDFDVKNLQFIISGQQTGNDTQLPIITVVLDIQNKRFEDVKVKIQTTVSQRNLDVF